MLLYKRKWRYSMLLALLLVGLLAGIQLKDKYFKFSKNLEIFATILKELDSHYVDEVDTEALVKTGIDAMLRSLDPYTTFFSEEDLESFQTSITGEYGGIGAVIGRREGKAIIFMLFKNKWFRLDEMFQQTASKFKFFEESHILSNINLIYLKSGLFYNFLQLRK